METIGGRIAFIRKQKGLTQEGLSEQAGINLRTLQRIEKNETSPRGNTLQMLCKILDVPLEEFINYEKDEDRNFLIWFHLSPAAGLFMPLGQIILPLILWLTRRDKIKDLYTQGANVINFQLWWTAFVFLVSVINMSLHLNVNSIELSMFILLGGTFFSCLIYPVVIAIRIAKGTAIKPFYPWLIRIIK